MTETPHVPIEISIVMPCLNEEDTIAACIEKARAGIERCGKSGEVVVADNGSTERSVEIAEAAGARVVHVALKGYGSAYRGGLAAARGAIIVMGDSDDTYDFSRIDALVRLVEQGADLVLGSRLKGEISPGAMPFLHRYVGNPILSFTLNLFYGTRISDTHSGLRAFRREKYETLPIRSTGMEFASEMLILAARAHWTIAETPITYAARGGESKLRTFRDGWRHLRLLLLYSPTHLFAIPGWAMTISGAILLAALARGPLRIRGVFLDYHFLFLGSLLATLGTQVLTLGVFAKSWRRPPSWFTLERGLVPGALLFFAGIAINVGLLIEWLEYDFGPTGRARPAIIALTLTVVGAQILFWSFYLDLLRSTREEWRPALDADAPANPEPRSR